MTAFLSWIFAQAGKVYDWFGDEYYSLRQAAANAWTWAVQNAQSAYNNAIGYAWQVFQGAENDIHGLYDWVTWQIQNISQQLSPLIQSIEQTVTAWFDARLQDVWTFIQSVQSGIQSTAAQITTNIQAWVNSLIPNIITLATNAFGWLIPIRVVIEAIASLFNPDNIGKLVKLFGDWWQTLTLFLDNPTGFIFDLLSKDFLSFLSWLLAWALGTTENDLPTQTPWRK